MPWRWIGLLVLALMALLGTAFLPRFWSNPAEYHPVKPAWWFFGDAVWQGFVRSLVPAVIAGWFLILAVAAMMLANQKTAGPELAVWLGLGFLLFGLLGLSIVFFNWPKFLVPPSLRHQPGALQAWFGRSSG